MIMPDVEAALTIALERQQSASELLIVTRAIIEYGKATGREFRASTRHELITSGDWITSSR